MIDLNCNVIKYHPRADPQILDKARKDLPGKHCGSYGCLISYEEERFYNVGPRL